jgi:hypothetical protein
MSDMPRRGYEQNYDAAKELAADWSVSNLTAALQALIIRSNKTEGTWGAIDALADLLNKNAL